MMKIRCALCVDVGTSSLKAACISSNGKVLSHHREFFGDLSFSNPKVYEEAFIRAGKKLLREGDFLQRAEIVAISISGNGPTLACEDFLFKWDAPVDSTAGVFSTKSLFLPRLLHIRNRFPKIWENTEQFCSGPEFLIYMLSGEKITLLPEKRFITAYWTEDELKELSIPKEKLAPYVSLGDVCGFLLSKPAEELGLPGNKIPIFCAGPDFTAAMIGTGTLTEGSACDRAGTSEGINFCTSQPIFAPGVRTLPSVMPNLWNIGCVISNSGERFSRFKNRSQYKDMSFKEAIDDILAHPDSMGYTLIENIALEVKETVQKIENLTGKKFKSMCVTGAQAHNRAWLKFKSRILGLPLYTTKCIDAELAGNAVVAFLGLKDFSSPEEAVAHIVKVDYSSSE